MKSNNEIVEYIYKNIPLDQFISKVINSSTAESREDLRQYILLYFLEYDNTKLNILYDKNILPQFSMKIILNQRNYYKSFFNEYCKNNNNKEEEIEHETYDSHLDSIEKNRKIDFIERELNRKDIERELYIRYSVYKIYMTRKYTLIELADKYNLSYNTLFRLIRETKKIIRDRYDEYIRNIDNHLNNQ